MARKAIQHDQIVKLIVGAGQASPQPPVGPALGSKGVKSMDFSKVRQSTIGPRPLYLTLDRSSMPAPLTSHQARRCQLA